MNKEYIVAYFLNICLSATTECKVH